MEEIIKGYIVINGTSPILSSVRKTKKECKDDFGYTFKGMIIKKVEVKVLGD